MGTFGTVHVDGLLGLMRAFSEIDKDLTQDLVFELEEAADPVRKRAEIKVGSEISGLRQTPFYSRFRIGVSRKDASVYVLPKWSGTKRRERKRPNLAREQQPRLEKAAEASSAEIEKRLEEFLDRLVNDFNRR